MASLVHRFGDFLAEKLDFGSVFGRGRNPRRGCFRGLTWWGGLHSFRASFGGPWAGLAPEGSVMKVRNSLRSLKKRDKDCRVIRRKGRVYVINKKNPRLKARQG